jgi:NAD(P)-dependent dehydrogenase (short-subunit alcohol dehydrogenase family)
MASPPPQFHFRSHKTVYPSINPTRPDLSAVSKTILITGGAKGIGRGITESFCLAGALNIIIIGREASALETVRTDFASTYPDTTIWPFAVDITNSDRCKELLSEIRENIGLIDVMVLNAAYLHTPSPISSMDIQDFWSCFQINVLANTQLTQVFLQSCNPSSATLINISSYVAWLGALPLPAQGYAASKAALDCVIGYVGQQNERVRCFTMHPGAVVTPMLEKIGADVSREGVFDDGESSREQMHSLTVLSPLSYRLLAS